MAEIRCFLREVTEVTDVFLTNIYKGYIFILIFTVY